MPASQLHRTVSLLSARAALPGLLLPYGLWRLGVRQDYSVDSIVLAAGSLMTWIGVTLYSTTLFIPRSSRSWGVAFRVWAGLFPWLFISYLFFYKGLWGLISLVWQFSLFALAGAFFFISLSWQSIKALEVLSSDGLKAACVEETHREELARATGTSTETV
jgi:hypothetical protein